MRGRMEKREKGVTMISLVVTIIVLLILAGISIAMLTGDNGLITKANQAKRQTDIAQAREFVELKWIEIQQDIGTRNPEELANKLQEELRKTDKNATVTYVPENKTYEVLYQDIMIEIQGDETVTTSREDVKEELEDMYKDLDSDLSQQEKADKLNDELSKKDENSSATYDPDTGKIIVDHGGYQGEIDDKGNVEIVKPNVTEKASVTITSQPVNTSVLEGETATFEVKANITGEEKYQWYENTVNSSETGTAITGANSSRYTTGALQSQSKNVYYYCKITAELGGQTEEKTTNVVKAEVVTKVEVLAAGQTEQSVLEGESASFEVTANGGGTITYQWYQNNTDSNTGGTEINGATSANYTIPNTSTDMNGNYYYCVVTQQVGSKIVTVSSDPVKLNVTEKLKITAEPEAVTTIAGKPATFQVTATSGGSLTYQWYQNSTSSNNGGTAITGATNNVYTIEATTKNQSGTYYYCVVTQNYEGRENTVKTKAVGLTVADKLSITVQPQEQGGLEGESATFGVTAIGEGSISYQWYQNTSESNENGTPINGATGNTYTIQPLTQDQGNSYYYCVITQNYNGQTETITTRPAKLEVAEKVKITTQPVAQNKLEGNNAIFEVTATGGGTISYQWYQNSTNSNNGGTAIEGATNPNYSIENTSKDKSGTYIIV